MPLKRKRLSMRISEDLKEKVEAIAAERDMSVSELISRLIERLPKPKPKPKSPQE